MRGDADRALRTSLALLGLLCALPARAPAAETTPERAEILVAAAASLRESAQAIADGFAASGPGRSALVSFGASSALAWQILAGAPIDVFLSADLATVDPLVAAGLVRPEAVLPFASNRLVVIRSAALAAPIGGARDLLRPEVRRIALPAAAVPLGHYAREWLAGAGVLAQVEPRLVTTEHARAALAAVDLGHADCGIVYATDARVAKSARVAFEVRESEQPGIRYAAAPLARSEARPEVAAFLAFLRGPEARRALAAAGFSAPEAPVRP